MPSPNLFSNLIQVKAHSRGKRKRAFLSLPKHLSKYDGWTPNRAFRGSVSDRNQFQFSLILFLPLFSIWKIKLDLKKLMQNLFRFGWNSSSTASWRHMEEILIFHNKQVNFTSEVIKEWWNTKWLILDVLLMALEVCWSGSPTASWRHLEEIRFFYII